MDSISRTPVEALERIDECKQDITKAVLNLNSLNLDEIPPEINSPELSHITSLDLSSNKIKEIRNLEFLKNLRHLYVNRNLLTEIKGLDELGTLQDLGLSENLLTKISGLDNLKQLTHLHIYLNQISEISGLEKLTKLTHLFLFSNQIDEIKGLENLTNLKTLYLGTNKISEIKGLDNLKKLAELHLFHNKIKEIKGLDNLISLKKLDLYNNQISEINHLSVLLLDKLSFIDLRLNPIKRIPIDDLSDRDAIIGYIRSLHDRNEKITNVNLKMNIIGTGRIGKTQLFNYFNGQVYQPLQAETHGTQTAHYYIPGTNYHVTIWDFGGQSYHHGFHYLFLRPKDFYLVLWRNEKGTPPDYAYWLGTARHFAGGMENGKYLSPLLLVQNRWTTSDDNKAPFTADETAYPSSEKLQKYQLALSDVFCIDVKSLFNKNNPPVSNSYFLETLHEKMIAHCRQINDLPKEFVEIKRKLDNKPIEGINIKKSDFRKKYAKDFDDDRFAYLLQYLEFTGNIITFREIEKLNQYVFPNPPDLSDWIYKTVLNDEFKNSKEGKITRKELIKKTKSKENAEIFLNLMNEFQLIFEQPFPEEGKDSNDKYYIIPQFLPEYKHSFKQVLLELLPFTFSLQFSDFIHEGRFFRFISEYGRYAKDNSAYWKYGLLFGYELNPQILNKPPEQKQKDTIQVLAYYVTAKRQVMVHIEDKKGKSEVAKELFYFFAAAETPRSAIRETDAGDARAKLRKRSGPHAEIKTISDELVSELFYDKKRKYDYPVQDYIQLCTNGYNYFDVKDTKDNIAANNYFGKCTHTQARVKLDFMAINLLSDDDKRKLRIFFSYSHKDEPYRDELEKHLTLLKRNGRIETWHDRKILAGDNWNEMIKDQIRSADVVLLMISADFLYSDYIWEQELGLVRERYKNKDGITIIPIFTRPCDTAGLDFMEIQGGQRDKQSSLPWISSSQNRDQTYTDIVNEIRKTIDGLK